VHEDEAPSAPPPSRPAPVQPVAAPSDAPTLSMSNTPTPRRIERRKIIALRLAAGTQRMPGAQLKAAFEAESLQHGRYDVFHRLDEEGNAMFSIASMVEPGTFNLEKMSQETFPGITLFTQLPGPVAGMLAFNELVACSRRLHAALGGTLQDERGVPLTVHRVERIRQEIRDFELRPAAETQRSGSTYSSAPE
jgi:cell division protein ZipA